MIKYVTPVSLGILLTVWLYQAGFDVILLKNADPVDIPYLLMTRGIILGLIVVSILQVRRVSKSCD